MFEGAILAGMSCGLVRGYCDAATRLQATLATRRAVVTRAQTPLSEAVRQQTPSQLISSAACLRGGADAEEETDQRLGLVRSAHLRRRTML